MKAIKFEECNVVYAQNQDEYLPLPAHRTENGDITVCFKFSFDEIIKFIKTEKLYLQILTFNNPLQPIKMSVEKPEL